MKQEPLMTALGVAFLTYRRYQQRRLVGQDITLKQIFLLRQLDKQQFLYPAQIAEVLFCDRPTATVVIRNMAKRGWVDRRQDPEHAKRFQISITEEGREKLKSVDRFFRAHAGESFDPFSCFTKAEKQELGKLLSKLNQHLSILRN